jgi:lipopolysaccharide transport system permease protein
MSPRSFLDNLNRLVARRETIRYLTTSNLKSGHRDKVLGHLWYLLDPLAFMLVYYLVFGVLFNLAGGGRDADFMLYILSGILIWRFFSGTVSQGANCIRGNRGLIHEINFPKAVFPVSVTLARAYDLVWGLAVYVVATMVAGEQPTLTVLWVPPLLLLLLMFVMGMTFITAFLGVYFADTTNVLDVALRLGFYCSPIFYYVRPKESLPADVVFLSPQKNEQIWNLYMSNPVACFFECFRDAILWHETPDMELFGYAATVSVVVWIVGFILFSRSEGAFAKYI